MTTHLGYETVTALREAVCDWDGAVLLASHDRWFMRGAVEGGGGEVGKGDDTDEGGDKTSSLRVVYRFKGVDMTGGVDQYERL